MARWKFSAIVEFDIKKRPRQNFIGNKNWLHDKQNSSDKSVIPFPTHFRRVLMRGSKHHIKRYDCEHYGVSLKRWDSNPCCQALTIVFFAFTYTSNQILFRLLTRLICQFGQPVYLLNFSVEQAIFFRYVVAHFLHFFDVDDIDKFNFVARHASLVIGRRRNDILISRL